MEGIGIAGDWDRQLFQGNELISFKGYNTYDFNLRHYDPWQGRFTSLDPVDIYGTSPYAGMMNNPAYYTDPNGDCPICLVYAAAALIGGGSNLWSNWDKVKDFNTGLAYFGSGAIGGAVAVTAPFAGGATTAGANALIDVATGNIPKFENFWDVAKYTGSLALDGLGASGAGQLAQTGVPRLLSYFSSDAVASTVGKQGFQRVGQVGSALYELESTAEIVVRPAIRGFGQNTLAQGIKQGLNFADDAGQGFKSFNAFKNAYGRAGQGQAWHHIVEQHADNIGKFGAEAIHNTNNLVKLPHGAGALHNKISGFYNSISPEITGSRSLRVRDWIKTQSFQEQYNFGLKAIERFSPR